MTLSEISPIQGKLQITLSENQINKLAEIISFLTRRRRILPYRFNTGCTTLVISLILASFIVVLLKRSLAHVAYQGMDKEISTRKVFMSGLGWISEQLRFVLQVIMRSDE